MKNVTYKCCILFLFLRVSSSQEYNKHLLFLKNTYAGDMFPLKVWNDCFSVKKELTVITRDSRSITSSENFKNYFYDMNAVIKLRIQSENLTHFTTKPKYYKLDSSTKDFIPFPADKFCIHAGDAMSLKTALSELRDTIWWNLDGKYFIKSTITNDSCEMNHQIFETVWKFDLHFVVFECLQENGEFSAYTFNPYTDYAPEIWIKISTHEQENGHPFAIFKLRNLSNSLITCKDIFFVKTRNIGGYPIKILGTESVKTPFKHLVASISFIHNSFPFGGEASEITTTVLAKLNATARVTIQMKANRTSVSSNIDEYGVPHGTMQEVLTGKYDMLLEFKFHRGIWKNQILTFMGADFCYVTSKNSLSLKTQILSIIPFNFRIYLIVILLIIIAVSVIFFKKITFLDVFLDMLRAITGVSTVYQPQSKTTKIMFISSIFIAMFVNYYFQANLQSLIVQNIPFSPIKTSQDIDYYNYTVCYVKGFKPFFKHTSFFSNMYKCGINKYKRRMNNSYTNVALVHGCEELRDFFSENEHVHITLYKDYKMFYVVLVRDNFGLRKPMGILYMRLFESGITRYWFKRYANSTRHETENFSKATAITMKNMGFTFWFLCGGLVLSCAIFLLELFCLENHNSIQIESLE